jgi:hypothetical protein
MFHSDADQGFFMPIRILITAMRICINGLQASKTPRGVSLYSSNVIHESRGEPPWLSCTSPQLKGAPMAIRKRIKKTYKGEKMMICIPGGADVRGFLFVNFSLGESPAGLRPESLQYQIFVRVLPMSMRENFESSRTMTCRCSGCTVLLGRILKLG